MASESASRSGRGRLGEPSLPASIASESASRSGRGRLGEPSLPASIALESTSAVWPWTARRAVPTCVHRLGVDVRGLAVDGSESRPYLRPWPRSRRPGLVVDGSESRPYLRPSPWSRRPRSGRGRLGEPSLLASIALESTSAVWPWTARRAVPTCVHRLGVGVPVWRGRLGEPSLPASIALESTSPVWSWTARRAVPTCVHGLGVGVPCLVVDGSEDARRWTARKTAGDGRLGEPSLPASMASESASRSGRGRLGEPSLPASIALESTSAVWPWTARRAVPTCVHRLGVGVPVWSWTARRAVPTCVHGLGVGVPVWSWTARRAVPTCVHGLGVGVPGLVVDGSESRPYHHDQKDTRKPICRFSGTLLWLVTLPKLALRGLISGSP
ncbi:hypothetical protein LuPra_04647 [Luteitalea pratensis]|uniref:Uncharacterized protein n=1 Tax=Luteitalea pratensis TaxID=1855912 RepID=A0A143PRN9_LUTPR|nr:hypothetical protein LuPra_04647 [Luteitalea pratensis]